MNVDSIPSVVGKRVYSAIQQTPGTHFRALVRSCSVSTGQLSHHVSSLKKLGLIREEKQGRHARFYPLGLNDHERSLLGVLRNPTSRKIVISLLQKSPKTHKELGLVVDLSPSTLSWHLDNLKSQGVLLMQKRGKENFYSLAQAQDLTKALVTHRVSFLDKLVDNFIESWEK